MTQARSQDFSWGEGGGMRTSNRGTKYFYVVMIRNATVPKTHKEECPTHGLTEMGTNFNGTENFCERRRLRGSESLFLKKTPFPIPALSGR